MSARAVPILPVIRHAEEPSILDDASVEETVQGLSTASLLNTGQTCYMSTRIFALASRYHEFVDAITGMASSLPVGDPLDPGTYVGPVVSKTQRERVLGYIEAGKKEGATLTTGPDRIVRREPLRRGLGRAVRRRQEQRSGPRAGARGP